MMKVLLLCNSDVLALPAALKLEQEGMLSAIVVPESNANQLLIMAQQIGIGIDKVHAVTKKKSPSGIKRTNSPLYARCVIYDDIFVEHPCRYFEFTFAGLL
jgi:hypothetical protein